MGLLWDVLQALSGATGSADLAEKVVDRLFTRAASHARRALRVGRRRRAAALRPAAARRRRRAARAAGRRHHRSRARHRGDGRGDERACARRRVTTRGDAPAADARRAARDRRPHAGRRVPGRAVPSVLDVDRTDLHVLTGVANQLAVALDREHLAELHRVRAEHERRRLQAELQDLRSQQSPIVFQSAAMADLLVRARRVASTDTTVLVTGESGTGKEMLAQTLHQLSGRRAKPVRDRRLRRHSRHAHRLGALRPRARRVHRRAAALQRAGSPWPTAAPCSSTRSASCRSTCSRGCCASCRRRPSRWWAARARARSTCASSPPPTAGSRTKCGPAASARICSIA